MVANIGGCLDRGNPEKRQYGASLNTDAGRERLICPDCGAPNLDDAKYCTSCARQLYDIESEEDDGSEDELESGLDGWDAESESYAPDELGVSSAARFVLRVAIGLFAMVIGVGILVIIAREEPKATELALVLFVKGLVLFVSTAVPFFVSRRGEVPSFLKRTSTCLYDTPPLVEVRALPLPYLAFPFTGLYLVSMTFWYRDGMQDGLLFLTVLAILVMTALSVIYVTTGRIEFRADGMHARQGLNPSSESWISYDHISSVDINWRIVSVKLRGVPKGYDSCRIYLLRSDPDRFRTDVVRTLRAHIESAIPEESAA
jgi:hypothetical protein